MRVLHILQSDNIENDYRLIKECQTIIALGYKTEILYFHVNNKKRKKGVLFNDIPWVRKQLFCRLIFSSGRFLLIKLIEQWVRSALYVINKKPEVVCVHDERFFGLIPILYILKHFGLIERLLWDQRELPTTFLGRNKYKLKTLRRLLLLCDGVAMANKERKEIVVDQLKLQFDVVSKIHCIANYPDLNFVNAKLDLEEISCNEIFNSINKPYIYLQSPTEPERFFHNTVEAILRHENLQLLVSGRVYESDIAKLVEKFGEIINKKVVFTGLIDPFHLPFFIDNAVASCIFYDKSSLNRMYCAPNRLYQSISRGIPVLVGDNPPLKNTIEATKSGIIIDGDGAKTDAIARGISEILKNQENLKEHARRARKNFSWENQIEIVENFFCAR